MPIGYSDSSIDRLLENVVIHKRKGQEPIKFLVGHQGNPGENQFEIVTKLLSYKKKNMEIILPLSYGDKEYIRDLVAKLEKLKDDRIHILKDFISLGEYLQLLADIDIAIFDEKGSMALGNIAYLLYFRKKIILNDESIVKKAFVHEHLPYGLTLDIGIKEFDEIIKPVQYLDNQDSDLIFQPYPVRCNRYIKLFDYLDSLKK